MGKFWQISTELRPLIDVRSWFSLSISGISLPIFFKLCMKMSRLGSQGGVCCMHAAFLFFIYIYSFDYWFAFVQQQIMFL